MRKIEENMVNAIKRGKCWTSGNTEVFTNKNGASLVYLHGNHIATVTYKKVTLFDGGWKTNTTKSRLNAICDTFCLAGEGVFQKDFTWYVRRLVGGENGETVYADEPFESGVTL